MSADFEAAGAADRANADGIWTETATEGGVRAGRTTEFGVGETEGAERLGDNDKDINGNGVEDSFRRSIPTTGTAPIAGDLTAMPTRTCAAPGPARAGHIIAGGGRFSPL